MATKVIRLITGEFLMANIKEETETGMQLEDAVILLVGKDNVGFTHLNPFGSSPENVTVNAIHVLFSSDPAEDLLGEYNRIFSKIITPPTTILQ